MMHYKLKYLSFDKKSETLNSNANAFDYTRFFYTIRQNEFNLIYCLIEDFDKEPSAFFPAHKLLKTIYSVICQNYEKINQIKQYSRCKNPSKSSNLLRESTYTRENLTSVKNSEKLLNILHSFNKANDNLTLFFLSLHIWNEYLVTKIEKGPHFSCVYVKSIIYNFILLAVKEALTFVNDPSFKSTVISREIDSLQSDMVHFVLASIKGNEHLLGQVVEMVN